jgi:hypothetical protein
MVVGGRVVLWQRVSAASLYQQGVISHKVAIGQLPADLGQRQLIAAFLLSTTSAVGIDCGPLTGSQLALGLLSTACSVPLARPYFWEKVGFGCWEATSYWSRPGWTLLVMVTPPHGQRCKISKQ